MSVKEQIIWKAQTSDKHQVSFHKHLLNVHLTSDSKCLRDVLQMSKHSKNTSCRDVGYLFYQGGGQFIFFFH